MKKPELIALGLAAVAVYLIVQSKGAKNPFAAISQKAAEVFDQGGKAFANGWRYFTDGTSIDPSGNYYREGQLIWTAPGNTQEWATDASGKGLF